MPAPLAYDSDDYDYDLEYQRLLAEIKPIVKACSLSSFSSNALYSLYASSRSRRRLLIDARSSLRVHFDNLVAARGPIEADSVDDFELYDALSRSYRSIFCRSLVPSQRSSESEFSGTLSSLMLLAEKELAFVDAVCNRLDINNILDVGVPELTGAKVFHLFAAFDAALVSIGCESLDPLRSISPSTPLRVAWRKYSTRLSRHVRDTYMYSLLPGVRDMARDMLVKATIGARRAVQMQRVTNEVQRCHDAGWYIAFDTLTFHDDGLAQFLSRPRAMRDYFNRVGDTILESEAHYRRVDPSFSLPEASRRSDCFRYFCVPELGGKTGRLHFHVIYLFRTKPIGLTDPNLGWKLPQRREIKLFGKLWPYGFTSCYPVRCTNDRWTLDGWRWPVDKKGVAYPCKPVVASAYYVAKYVNKHGDTSLELSGVGGLKCSQETMNEILALGRSRFNVRMSRGFGEYNLNFQSLDLFEVADLMNLAPKIVQHSLLLKRNARRELMRRLLVLPLSTLLDAAPEPVHLLRSLRLLIQQTPAFSLVSSTPFAVPKLTVTDISDAARRFIQDNDLGWKSAGFGLSKLPGAR